MKTAKLILMTGVLLLATSAATGATVPTIRHSDVTTQSAAAGLEPAFRALLSAQSDAFWVGYEVPSLPGHLTYCGYHGDHDCICRLESHSGSYTQTTSDDSDEGLDVKSMFVLFRVADHRINRIRVLSSFCSLDAGGLPFYWLDDVKPSESVALLETITDPGASFVTSSKDIADEAITAIAFQSDPAAEPALERMVQVDRPAKVRRTAVFWIGQSSSSRGVDVLRRLVRDDPDHEVREGAVFALSCSKAPGAMDLLIETARKNPEAKVRSNAIFWLANKAGDKSSEAIADAVENDPDTEVKEHAVFALSQLPKDRGVPLLIDVARNNRNAKVREQAIFWLGQSEDPRALDFFEEVLSH